MIVYEDSDNQACFLQMHLGGDRNFCYLLGDIESKEAAAVDPGFRAARFASAASDRGLQIARILLTHGHSDHADKAAELSRITGAPVYAGGGEDVPGAVVLNDGELLALGRKAILAFHTPGHTPGHMCYLFGKKLITGDLLFCGKVGGTGSHFPGSSAEAEWESLRRIMKLPDDVEIFPGHDYYGGKGRMPHSTIGYERRVLQGAARDPVTRQKGDQKGDSHQCPPAAKGGQSPVSPRGQNGTVHFCVPGGHW